MAIAGAILSGTWRVSSTSSIFTQTFSNTVSCSTFMMHDVVGLPGTSEFLISLAELSNCQMFTLQANEIVRVNFGGIGGASHVSLASAGQACTQYMWAGSAISGLLNVHIANSTANSATVRMIFGQ